VAPELEEVVCGGDEAPFCLAGGEPAALEPVGASDDLGVREDGLDHRLSSREERAAVLCEHHALHVRIGQ
jgi:hypothetical protein